MCIFVGYLPQAIPYNEFQEAPGITCAADLSYQGEVRGPPCNKYCFDNEAHYPCQCEQQVSFKGNLLSVAQFVASFRLFYRYCEMRLRSGISLSARCKLLSEHCGGLYGYAGVARLLGLVSVCAKMASLNVLVVPSTSTQHCVFCILACARDWSSVGGGLCSVSALLDTRQL